MHQSCGALVLGSLTAACFSGKDTICNFSSTRSGGKLAYVDIYSVVEVVNRFLSFILHLGKVKGQGVGPHNVKMMDGH